MKVWRRYVLLNSNTVHFCDIFFNIGQCFRPTQTKSLGNQKSGHVRIIQDNKITFSKYFRPLHKLVQATDMLQTTDYRQQTEFKNYRQRQTFLRIVSNVFIYGPGSRVQGLFSGSCKNSGNIQGYYKNSHFPISHASPLSNNSFVISERFLIFLMFNKSR